MKNTDKNYAEQQENIINISHYKQLFVPPVLNSFSFSCSNIHLEKDSLSRKGLFNVGVLNDAGYDLYNFCINIVEEIRNIKGKNFDFNVRSFEHSILVWKKFIEAERSYATFEYAKLVIDTIIKTGYPLVEKLHLPDNKFIINKFKSIPERTKFFVRLTNYGEENDRRFLLEKLFKFFYDNSDLFQAIERVEIAVKNIPKIKLSNDAPSFSIFFNYDYVTGINKQEVTDLISFFETTDIIETQNNLNISYSKRISQNTYLSQGFNNYKKYLALMDAIGLVYDKESNYAIAGDCCASISDLCKKDNQTNSFIN